MSEGRPQVTILSLLELLGLVGWPHGSWHLAPGTAGHAVRFVPHRARGQRRRRRCSWPVVVVAPRRQKREEDPWPGWMSSSRCWLPWTTRRTRPGPRRCGCRSRYTAPRRSQPNSAWTGRSPRRPPARFSTGSERSCASGRSRSTSTSSRKTNHPWLRWRLVGSRDRPPRSERHHDRGAGRRMG